MWRYTGVRDFWKLAQACVMSTILVMMIILTIHRFQGYSRAVFIGDGVITFMLAGGVRMLIRSFYEKDIESIKNLFSMDKDHLTKVLIVGAGDAGEKILREIMDNDTLHYDVVGFVDDDIKKQGLTIHGVRVLGIVDSLPKIFKKESIQQILIAVPSASGEQVRRIVDACQHCNATYKILPGIGELIDGRVSIKLLRDINYEDLLGRPPVHLNVKDIRNSLDGKTVLVTGCGGSIGSELCRQVIKYQPGKLILLDSSEPGLFKIQMEIQNKYYFSHCVTILGRVQDESLMDDILKSTNPRLFFTRRHISMSP